MSSMVSETNQAMLERSMRSVFVGNIPFDLTEERLKEIFSEVGPVLSFKLVYDRESGKPKGYGFCEYKDIEMANCAMRNLNGYEIGGRILKVDNAANEKSRLEMQNVLQGIDTSAPPVNNFDDLDAEKAPEAISRAVASLPPEQMFELMKQMKQCIQNNPTEARNMLLTNPQLAYALLQAQVVLRLVDPHTAVSMLHKSNTVPEILQPQSDMKQMPRTDFVQQVPVKPQVEPDRQIDPRMIRALPMGDIDLRGPVMPPIQNTPFQSAPIPEPVTRDPRQQAMNVPPMPVPMPVAPPRDPRAALSAAQGAVPVVGVPSIPRQPQPVPVATRPPLGLPTNIGGSGASDQEKAALIVQVLQLSDEQIAMLPPEQRQSILVLKEQIAKSAHQQSR